MSSPPANSFNIEITRQNDGRQPSGSAPRSNRLDASVDMARLLALFRIATGLKYALSTSTVVVVSETAESKPPMTPANATGDLPSVIRR